MTKLAPEDVEYLSFAGGGGKGAAYLGVLAAASHDDVGLVTEGTDGWKFDTDQIEGVAGASAGAITAALVAGGHNLEQVQTILLNGLLDEFYDEADETTSYVPKVTLDDQDPVTGPDGKHKLGTETYDRSAKKRWSWFLNSVASPSISYQAWKPSNWNNQPLQRMYRKPSAYTANLWYDFGAFSGATARTVLSKLLTVNYNFDGVDTREGREVTFEQFADHDDTPELRVIGSNLRTAGGEVFDAANTGPMKVADALRISMSIPLAFKPVEIPADVTDHDDVDDRYRGLWVDGGLRNNHPIHAFDEGGQVNDNVLGLNLRSPGEEGPSAMRAAGQDDLGIGSFVGGLMGVALENSGTGQIHNEQERDQTLEVPIGGLDTLSLQPDKGEMKKAVKSAAVATFNYFDVEPDNGTSGVDRLLNERLAHPNPDLDLQGFEHVESTDELDV